MFPRVPLSACRVRSRARCSVSALALSVLYLRGGRCSGAVECVAARGLRAAAASGAPRTRRDVVARTRCRHVGPAARRGAGGRVVGGRARRALPPRPPPLPPYRPPAARRPAPASTPRPTNTHRQTSVALAYTRI